MVVAAGGVLAGSVKTERDFYAIGARLQSPNWGNRAPCCGGVAPFPGVKASIAAVPWLERQADLLRLTGRGRPPVPGPVHHLSHLREPPARPSHPSLTSNRRAEREGTIEAHFQLLSVHSQSLFSSQAYERGQTSAVQPR